jgi:hypothetical protein
VDVFVVPGLQQAADRPRLYIRARNAWRVGAAPRSGSKKILDRILKPGKLNGNVGTYDDEAELI